MPGFFILNVLDMKLHICSYLFTKSNKDDQLKHFVKLDKAN